MIKSKTKIESQLRRKNNVLLVQTVIEAKKSPKWILIAQLLAAPGRNLKSINLSDIESAKGNIIVVPGKILSGGVITKKIKVAALNFSQKAREKLLNAGCELTSIIEEIKNNKDAKGVTIIRK